MAILRSSDGKFYDVADDQLDDKLIPAEQIKEKLGRAALGSGPDPSHGPETYGPGPDYTVPGTGGQVVIQIYPSAPGISAPGAPVPGTPSGFGEPAQETADVEAHGWCWRRNYFSNCWRRNCWRNYCRRW